VVAAAKALPNLRQAELGEFTAEVHRNLAGIYQNPAPVASTEIIYREAEVGRGLGHDRAGSDLWADLIWDEVFKNDLCQT